MIYFAKFTGRKLNAIGAMYLITAYCSGEDENAARLDLYDRYQDLMHLELKARPMIKLGEVKPDNYVQLVKNGRVIPKRGCKLLDDVTAGLLGVIDDTTGQRLTLDPNLECVLRVKGEDYYYVDA